jgi:hypothetical protein
LTILARAVHPFAGGPHAQPELEGKLSLTSRDIRAALGFLPRPYSGQRKAVPVEAPGAIVYEVHSAAEGAATTSVTTDDLAVAIDNYRRARGVVETVRYGQYL